MSRADFADKEYRDAFAREFVSGTIATQLKVLREDRNLTQAQLAEKAGMKQSRISAMEDVNYSRWNIRTLQRLAEALDIALVVRFESFGALLAESNKAGRAALARPSYADDPVFAEGAIAEYVAPIWAGVGADTIYTQAGAPLDVAALVGAFDEFQEKAAIPQSVDWATTTSWIEEVA